MQILGSQLDLLVNLVTILLLYTNFTEYPVQIYA
jgi:hypothetical protein